jgi:esterase/lipase superfamily enzyme
MICNRETEIINSKERFKNKGKEHALPKFRIAECTVKAGSDMAEYEILGNQYPSDYSHVTDALEDQSKAGSLNGSSLMFYELYSQMLGSKDEKSDCLVFIHGFANSFESNLEHIATLVKTFIKKGSPVKHLIFVSWPTRNHKILTYKDDQHDAEETGKVLSRVYLKLADFFVILFKIMHRENCENKIHLAAHSMGNQVLKAMLENIPDRKLHPFIGEVLLLHSDVEDTVFEPGQPFTKLEKLAERTHIYIHNSDDALLTSRFTKNFNKRLGKKGPKNRKNLNDETFVIDVTSVKSAESLRQLLWDHWGYIEQKVETDDIIEVLKGQNDFDIENRKRKNGETKYFYLLD